MQCSKIILCQGSSAQHRKQNDTGHRDPQIKKKKKKKITVFSSSIIIFKYQKVNESLEYGKIGTMIHNFGYKLMQKL